MKSTRCNHDWSPERFCGDPIKSHQFACTIERSCSLCKKLEFRTPSDTEFEAELKVRTCQTCGLDLHSHDNGGLQANDCIKLLVYKVKSLEDRLDDLDRWRHQ